MAHLSYGLSQGGCFIVLTGEVGTGKTTLCRNLLSELPPSVDVALILNANINEQELLQTLCDELRIEYPLDSSQKQLLDRINEHLLGAFSENRHTVLIIDEAQLLSRDVLEQIRLLTNLETTKAKLLQIILIGQPELNDLLLRNDLRQLAQRITARYHLGALRRNEIEDYVNFRLSVAGCKQPLFSRQALNKLHALTDGIPRKINVLADHALLATYANTARVVDAKTVQTAAADVFLQATSSAPKSSFTGSRLKWILAILAIVAVNLLLWWAFTSNSRSAPSQTEIKQELAVSAEKPVSPTSVIESKPKAQSAPEPKSIPQSEPIAANAVQGSAAPEPDIPTPAASVDTELAGAVLVAQEPLDASPEIPASLQTEFPALSANQTPIEMPANSAAEVTRSDNDTDLTRLLETSADQTSRITAFRKLAELWGAALPAQLLKPVCETLRAEDLTCLGFGNWQQMLRYNRPSVIVLQHNDQLHRVVLRSISGDTGAVTIADQTHQIPLAELKQRWHGTGVLLWMAPPKNQQFLQVGDRGPAILAAREKLNQALNKVRLPLLSSASNPDFDMDMAQKVFALQSSFKILDDSKIGNETWLLINELLTPDTPLMQRREQ